MCFGYSVGIEILNLHGAVEVIIQFHGRRVGSHVECVLYHFVGKRFVDVFHTKRLSCTNYLEHLPTNELHGRWIGQQLVGLCIHHHRHAVEGHIPYRLFPSCLFIFYSGGLDTCFNEIGYQLIENGFIYFAQPPLYQIKRGKKVEYIANDEALERRLLLGCDSLSFVRPDGTTIYLEQFTQLLEAAIDIETTLNSIRIRGVNTADYLATYRPEDGSFARYMAVIGSRDAAQFRFPHDDVALAAVREEGERALGESIDLSVYRVSEYAPKQLHAFQWMEVFRAQRLRDQFRTLAALNLGFSPASYYGDGTVLGELRDGTRPPVAISSLEQLINEVRQRSRRGVEIQRYKGLGEMDAKELFDTTMNPATRRMLKVKIEDASEADKTFSLLMGEDVEPRRKFIEDNALNVKNLDF